jgi:hypothetical protein
MKRRAALGQKGRWGTEGKEKDEKIAPFSPKFPRGLAPGGKERAQTGWIPAETCGEFVVEEEEVVVVEASLVGFVRVASWGNSGRRKALGGRSEARMGEKIK